MVSTALGAGILAQPAWCQATLDAPTRYALDANGINLATGGLNWTTIDASIGGKANGLSQTVARQRNGPVGSPYDLLLYHSGSQWWATWFDGTTYVREDFMQSGSTFTSLSGDGSKLSQTGSSWTLVRPDGTNLVYGYTTHDTNDAAEYVVARASQITQTDGTVITIGWASGTWCTINSLNCPVADQRVAIRIQGASSSYGYLLHYSYQGVILLTAAQVGPWHNLTKATLSNLAVDGCTAATVTCSYSQAWPSATYATTTSGFTKTEQVTDSLGRVTKYTYGDTTSVQRPASSSDDATVSWDTNGHVSSVVKDGSTWAYAFSLSGTTMTAVITNPDSTHRTVISDTTVGLPTSVTDELNHTTSYTYDSYGRLKTVTAPEGNTTTYTYDTHGNITQTVLTAKTGGATITTSANYPCTSDATCAEPQWTKDAAGNETDYTYDSATGLLLTATQPAPTTGAVRPKTTYSYSSKQAYFKNSAGSIVASGVPVSLLTGVSTCQITASCAGTADEVKTTLDYGPQVAGTANNLQLVSRTVAAGDGSVSAATVLGYDTIGNLTSIDGPLSGTADTTLAIYDADRELTEVVGPDPDGSGALKNRAVSLTYSPDGIVTNQAVGTSNADGGGFSTLQQVATTLDGADRPVRKVTSAGGTTYGVTDYSYDSAGRLDCTAVRMNPTYWATVTAACTAQTAGSAGPDRITRNTVYDGLNRVTSVVTAYGQTYASTESTTYNANGTTASVTDAENNKTTYLYDGFDRLSKTEYPSPTKGSGTSSTTDYEQLGYDADGNVTSRRLRDGTSITYGYDHLNRLVSKDLPGSEPDVTYGYDLLGRPTSVSQTGSALSFTYDALSRLLTETGPQGTMTSTWDAAGRRTKLQWPDTFYVTYDYDVLGEMTAVRENGATSGVGVLASYAYDDLGNRTSATFGNGTTSTWTPDAVSRLGTLTHNLAGTTYDLTKTFGYNPASQIASSTSSNDAYAWNAAANTNRNYTPNGLNQYTASGATSLGYDARGNLTSSGSDSYSYSSENLMTSGPGGTSLAYDPLLRLYQVTQGATTTRFGYDGLEMVAEYNAANALQKRYVFGPGTDEPIVQYTGAGTTSRNWLMADERGSVVALSDSLGNEVAVNSYDEYGIPGTANSGRFQYTGQTWLPEIGMYYYKARMYSPSLGRFMQTDPIGYTDGLNWYNYVGGDPVNFIDPMGTQDSALPASPPGPDIIVTGTRWKDQSGAQVGAAGCRPKPNAGLAVEQCGTPPPQNKCNLANNFCETKKQKRERLKMYIKYYQKLSDKAQSEFCEAAVGDAMRSAGGWSLASGAGGFLIGKLGGEGFGIIGAVGGYDISVWTAGLQAYLTSPDCK